MQAGRLGTTATDVHREAILMGAVRVFCTYVQHDVARMVHAGVTGDPERVFGAAIKNQLISGEGPRLASLVEKIVHSPDHMPVPTDESERLLLACVMADYENARLAVQAGLAAQYRSTHLLQNVMNTGSTIDASEETDEAVEAFLSGLNDSLTRWDSYAPSTAFEAIVHGMVLNAQG